MAKKQLLNTDDILLAQSDAWRKTDKNSLNSDQRMHMDYGNNTFLHPSDWNMPEAVAIIIYFSDINDTGGGTAIIPRQNDDLCIAEPRTTSYKKTCKNSPKIIPQSSKNHVRRPSKKVLKIDTKKQEK